VLCSDGLSGMIEDAEILDIVSRSGNIEEACRKLIALANEHGGEDNITAVLVRIVEEPGGEKVSLSDTLPTPLTAKLRQGAAAESQPHSAAPQTEPLPPPIPAAPADAHADTPPAPDTDKPKE
jgi:hypothetical protein